MPRLQMMKPETEGCCEAGAYPAPRTFGCSRTRPQPPCATTGTGARYGGGTRSGRWAALHMCAGPPGLIPQRHSRTQRCTSPPLPPGTHS